MPANQLDGFRPAGVIPAVVLPFDPDGEIDENAYRGHLRDVTTVTGISAITVNGHSQEIPCLNAAEQRRVLDVTLDEVGRLMPVVAGIYHDSSRAAADLARQAAAAGASALLVFPSNVLSMGGNLKADMVYAHFAAVADACDLPLISFEYSMASGLGYPIDTLVDLLDRVPSIVAIKDMCHEPQLHERHIRTLHSLDRPVSVLSTHSSWMLSSLVLGCDGLLSGAGSVIADLQVELFEAVKRSDLSAALKATDRMFPLTSVFYRPPMADMHNRMKEALLLLGRIPNATVRPPLTKLSADEVDLIRRALCTAGMLSP
jgi:4-hydroxy-tetrahydrodipicolinate synthase